MPIAQVVDGKIVESASQSSLSTKSTNNSGMDKEAFLQLLVAQMKYQDPLEPTSNTEYVSQYAQFSQVEQMQNMAGTLTLQRASGLVGQEVIIETTGSSGKTTVVQGKVDFIKYENNKALVSVNGGLYSLDDVTNVVDKEYQAAYDKALDYVGRVNKLPSLDNLTLKDEETVNALNKEYEEMTDYEKLFIAKDVTDKLKLYMERIKELKALAGIGTGDESGSEDSEDGGEGTGEAGVEAPTEGV